MAGSLCDSKLLFSPARALTLHRAPIISPCLARLPPLAKPPLRTRPAKLALLRAASLAVPRRGAVVQAGRIGSRPWAWGERARPLLSEQGPFTAPALPHPAECCNSTPQPAAEVPLTCPQAANLEYAQIDQAASHSIAVGNWLYRIATRLAHTPRPPTTQDLHLQAPCTLPPAGSVQVPRGYFRLVAIPDQRAAVRLVVVC